MMFGKSLCYVVKGNMRFVASRKAAIRKAALRKVGLRKAAEL